jgi:hypothetical protein
MHTYKCTAIATVHRKELTLEKNVRAAWNSQMTSDTVGCMLCRRAYHMMPVRLPKAVRKSARLRNTKSFLPVVLSSLNFTYVKIINAQPIMESTDITAVK